MPEHWRRGGRLGFEAMLANVSTRFDAVLAAFEHAPLGRPPVVIIGLSPLGSAQEIKEMMDCGVDAYRTIPISKLALVAVLAQHVQSWRKRHLAGMRLQRLLRECLRNRK